MLSSPNPISWKVQRVRLHTFRSCRCFNRITSNPWWWFWYGGSKPNPKALILLKYVDVIGKLRSMSWPPLAALGFNFWRDPFRNTDAGCGWVPGKCWTESFKNNSSFYHGCTLFEIFRTCFNFKYCSERPIKKKSISADTDNRPFLPIFRPKLKPKSSLNFLENCTFY